MVNLRNQVETLMQAQEDVIREAITKRLGTGWVIEDLEGRCRSITYPGGEELLYLDNEPILELRMPECDYSGSISISYRYIDWRK